MKKSYCIGVLTLAAALIVLFLVKDATAHTPLFSCWENGDGTLSCEGGFSDGSSATGVEVKVIDSDESVVLLSGKLNEFGEITFKKPGGAYFITFDAGAGHSITIKDSDIR